MAKQTTTRSFGVSRTATEERDQKKSYRKASVPIPSEPQSGQPWPPGKIQRRPRPTRYSTIRKSVVSMTDTATRPAKCRFKGFSGFEDVFSSFAASLRNCLASVGVVGWGRSAARAGADLRYDVQPDVRRSGVGVEKVLELRSSRPVVPLSGKAHRPGHASVPVNVWWPGAGREASRVFYSAHHLSYLSPGRRADHHPCPECRGIRRGATAQKKLSVQDPAGVDDGARLRLSGEGEEGGAAARPAILCHHPCVSHEFFERRGTEIPLQVPISFPQAALGAEIEVPSLHGPQTLTIPRGTRR